MTKFQSQGLYIIRIKYWNAKGSGSTPSLIPTHWNIGILLHKQAKWWTIMHTTVAQVLKPESAYAAGLDSVGIDEYVLGSQGNVTWRSLSPQSVLFFMSHEIEK